MSEAVGDAGDLVGGVGAARRSLPPTLSDAMAGPVRACRARVAATRALGPDILEADLVMEDPPALAFAAGQWVSVPFGPKTVRAYSIASTPQSPRRITLCADVGPGGIALSFAGGGAVVVGMIVGGRTAPPLATVGLGDSHRRLARGLSVADLLLRHRLLQSR